MAFIQKKGVLWVNFINRHMTSTKPIMDISRRYVHVAFEFIEWRRCQGNQTLILDNEKER